jgi:hypothetical protein
MVSAGVCFNGTGRLHFVTDKAKINADYYIRELLPRLVDDCELLMSNLFLKPNGKNLMATHFSPCRTVLLLTRHAMRKIG